MTNNHVEVQFEDSAEPYIAYPSKKNNKVYVVTTKIAFTASLTEIECPGLTNLADQKVRDLLIAETQRKESSALPTQDGDWTSGTLSKSGGLRAMQVFFTYEENDENK